MLSKSKLDSIATLVSQALSDIEISHEEFNVIIREKKTWEERKCEECLWEQLSWKTRKFEIG